MNVIEKYAAKKALARGLSEKLAGQAESAAIGVLSKTKQAGLKNLLGKVFRRRSWADKAKALSPAPKLKRPVTPLKITSGGVPLEKVLKSPRKQLSLAEQSAR